MKRTLSHRLLSALLALLVLTASVGMAVLQRTCRQTGTRTTAVVFSSPARCCPVPEPARETAPGLTKVGPGSACCDFEAHVHKLEVPAPALTWGKLLPTPAAADWLPTCAWPLLPRAPLVARAAAWHASGSSPPPRAGRQLLTFIQMLVV